MKKSTIKRRAMKRRPNEEGERKLPERVYRKRRDLDKY
jgi:hypothetical protein